MMKQYLETRAKNPDCLLFYRLGDFYEMFFEDAVTASRVLNLTLTSRSKGDDAVPMCGVPHHAAHHYIARLTDMGYRVAICDQVEDPRTAKGLVRREVTRVVSPGMVLDPELLDGKTDNFLAAAVTDGGRGAVAFMDVTTGVFRATEALSRSALVDEIAAMSPREIVIGAAQMEELGGEVRRRMPSIAAARADDALFEHARSRRSLMDHFRVSTLASFGGEGAPLAMRAAGALLAYVREMQRSELLHVLPPSLYSRSEYLVMDDQAVRNLELFAGTDGNRSGSLMSVLDFTRTSMGGRTLRNWVAFPLVDPKAINARLDAVAELAGPGALAGSVTAALAGIHDLDRLVSKASLRLASARDLKALGASLARLPALKAALAGAESERLRDLEARVDTMEDLAGTLAMAIADDPPPVTGEGGMIRPGYSAELDSLIAVSREGRGYIAGIESRERARTGIASLKVKYNRVFGYYLEVTRANLHLVPQDYMRRQTTANAERYSTPELKEYEEKVGAAQEQSFALELEIFESLREMVAAASRRVAASSSVVAESDALCSLAEAATRHGYTRPEVDDGTVLEIVEGRHPVVERTLRDERFVPNDTRLSPDGVSLMVITGPNMAGKSTVMRQVALIVIMAQAGSFVPAASAHVGVADRVFTRIGAGDSLTRGLSTFMVEMIEVATILNQATPKSLIILDEIGRGTSTYDGLSLAWSIAEDIHDRVRARTMLATHYHELTDLALTKPGIKNFTIAVREWRGGIVFLRRLTEGGASRSYGIQVAKLAGLPAHVTERSMEILRNLEAGEFDEAGMPRVAGRTGGRGMQLSLFDENAPGSIVARELEQVDTDSLTPLQALNLLSEIKGRIKEK
ncbi:MAG: DNA mismatch repair protein MutS [Myxococcota bacterium]